jgi:hypothetical protein
MANAELDIGGLTEKCHNDLKDYQACMLLGEMSITLGEWELAVLSLHDACEKIETACRRLYEVPGIAEWRSDEFVPADMRSISDVVRHLIYDREDDTEAPTYIEAYFLAKSALYFLSSSEVFDGCLALNASKHSLEGLPRDHEWIPYIAWDISNIGFNGWCQDRYRWGEAARHLMIAADLQLSRAVKKVTEQHWAIQSSIDFVNWLDEQDDLVTLPFSCSGRVSPQAGVWVDAYEQGPIASQSLAQFVGIDNVLQRSNAVMGIIRNIDCDLQPWIVRKSDIIMHNPFGFYTGTAQGGGFVVTTEEDSIFADLLSNGRTRFSAIHVR